MSINGHLSEIIGHLGAAQIQRAFIDDRIIADHIDKALEAAKALRTEITTREVYNNGDK